MAQIVTDNKPAFGQRGEWERFSLSACAARGEGRGEVRFNRSTVARPREPRATNKYDFIRELRE